MRFLVIFIFLISNTFANETPNIKNLIINKELKEYTNLTILDDQNNELNLSDYKGNILLLNFWATWCAPCKDEMPSLDKLQAKEGIFVYPINMEEKNLNNTDKFYKDLKIKNLNTYFDKGLKLVKVFALRGVPTTIILNKNKEMVARISGSIDFEDEKFISWLNSIR